MPVLNADNGLQLIDMRGLDYDDPAWEDLLDQLTLKDMESLAWLGYGNDPNAFHRTARHKRPGRQRRMA